MVVGSTCGFGIAALAAALAFTLALAAGHGAGVALVTAGGGAALGGRVVALHLEQEDAAALAAGLQVLGKVHRLVMGLAGLELERDLALEVLGQGVVVHAAVELRLAEVAVGLADQQVQLLRQHAGDVDLHARQVAHQQGQLLLAGQRQQRAAAHDGQLGREGLDLQDLQPVAAQQVAAGRLHALGHLDEEEAPAFGLGQAEGGGLGHLALAGDGVELHGLGALEHGRRHLGRVAPGEGLAAVLSDTGSIQACTVRAYSRSCTAMLAPTCSTCSGSPASLLTTAVLISLMARL
jgi:hypothetical protein